MKELEKYSTWAIIHELKERGAELTFFDSEGNDHSIDYVCVNGGTVHIAVEIPKPKEVE